MPDPLLAFVDLKTTGNQPLKNDFNGSERLYPWHEISLIDVVLWDPKLDRVVDSHMFAVKVTYPRRAEHPLEKEEAVVGFAICDGLVAYNERVNGAVLVAWDIGTVRQFLETAFLIHGLPIVTKGYVDLQSYTAGAVRRKHCLPLTDTAVILGIPSKLEGALLLKEVFQRLQKLAVSAAISAEERKREEPPFLCQGGDAC